MEEKIFDCTIYRSASLQHVIKTRDCSRPICICHKRNRSSWFPVLETAKTCINSS
uniref:Ultraviolet-B receptor UVR8-like n=1 Tax=Rhizophora mucronata TaxID=61149 RepID=A0A2P2LWC9_RHIMU